MINGADFYKWLKIFGLNPGGDIFAVKDACVVGTTGVLNATYNNGTAGVGATLTNAATFNSTFALGGVTPPLNARVLVKDELLAFRNGIYYLSDTGSLFRPWVLTRATDYDVPGDIQAGDLVLIISGTANMGSAWLQTATINTIGTDAINWAPWGVTNAGVGLTKAGNTISLANPVALSLGGTAAALTPSAGGLVYSTGSQLQILGGTGTAFQIPMSGVNAPPIWSNATYPSSVSANQLLYASAANTIQGLNSSASAALITDGSGVPSFSQTLPTAVQANITLAQSQVTGLIPALASKLALAGGIMLGTLTLAGNAVASLDAVPLQQLASYTSAITLNSTPNQITVAGSYPTWTFSFPSVLHSSNNVIDDGLGNASWAGSSFIFGGGVPHSPATIYLIGSATIGTDAGLLQFEKEGTTPTTNGDTLGGVSFFGISSTGGGISSARMISTAIAPATSLGVQSQLAYRFNDGTGVEKIPLILNSAGVLMSGNVGTAFNTLDGGAGAASVVTLSIGGKALVLGGNLTTTGASNVTFNFSGTTNATFPAGTYTVATVGGTISSILGTANQILANTVATVTTLSFPSVLHTLNGTILDDGAANMEVKNNLIVDGNLRVKTLISNDALSASMPVKTDASKNLVSAAINLANTDVTGTLPIILGGTGNTAYSPNGLLIGGSGLIVSGSIQEVTPPGFFQVLCSDAIGGVAWASTIPVLAQDLITNLSTVTTGTWQASVVGSQWGGTGVANGSGSTITLGAALTFSGAFSTTINVTGVTSITLPTSGTLVNTGVTTLASLVITESQVTNLGTDLASKLPLAGGTMGGLLILSGDPVTALGAVTKQYADAIAAGLDIKMACYAASTAQLTATYINGSSGVGATLTNSGTQAVFVTDGVTPPLNARILIKDQSSNTFQNGIYILNPVGSVSTNWVLTRTTDYNAIAEIQPGNLLVVDNGTANQGTGWLQTATVTTIGTSPILFSPFNLMQVGNGLSRAGNTISLATPVTLANGGTGASLTAVTNGVVVSTASALSILATGNNGILITSGAGVPSISSTLPSTVQGNITQLGAIAALTASQAVVTDASKNLTSLAYTSANTASTLVARDGSGNFSAGTVTASLTGNVTGNLTGTVLTAAQGNITSLGTLTSLTVSGLLSMNSQIGDNTIALYNVGGIGVTTTYGFGVQSSTLVYSVPTSLASHKFYFGGSVGTLLFTIAGTGQVTTKNSNILDNGTTGAATFVSTVTLAGNAALALQAVPLQQLTAVTGNYLPLAGGTLTGGLAGTSALFSSTLSMHSQVVDNSILLFDGGGGVTTNYGFGIKASTLVYSIPLSTTFHNFYFGGSAGTLLFSIAGTKAVTSANNTLDSGGATGNMFCKGGLSFGGSDATYGTALTQYDEVTNSAGSSFTFTGPGPTFGVFVNCRRLNNVVQINIAGLNTGTFTTSAAFTTFAGSLPTIFRPSINQLFPCIVRNNNQDIFGSVGIATNGLITINAGPPNNPNFTGGIVGWESPINVTYQI